MQREHWPQAGGGTVSVCSFDLLAPHYRWMECVLAGGKLQACRTMFVNQFAGAKDVLLLGEGNGRFLSELLSRNSSARITCVDSSAGMQKAARKRMLRGSVDSKRVSFVQADVLRCDLPEKGFDAIAANFFLDCFAPEQLERVIGCVAEWAAPDAWLIVSDFRCPKHGLKRWRAEGILALMYWFFRITTRLPARQLTAPQHLLECSGFRLVERREREWGLLYSELWRKGA